MKGGLQSKASGCLFLKIVGCFNLTSKSSCNTKLLNVHKSDFLLCFEEIIVLGDSCVVLLVVALPDDPVNPSLVFEIVHYALGRRVLQIKQFASLADGHVHLFCVVDKSGPDFVVYKHVLAPLLLFRNSF